MADHFRLSQEDRQEMLPSGKQATYKNRIAWARVYLSKALLLESPKRGFFRIAERGRELLKSNPTELGERNFIIACNIQNNRMVAYSKLLDCYCATGQYIIE